MTVGSVPPLFIHTSQSSETQSPETLIFDTSGRSYKVEGPRLGRGAHAVVLQVLTPKRGNLRALKVGSPFSLKKEEKNFEWVKDVRHILRCYEGFDLAPLASHLMDRKNGLIGNRPASHAILMDKLPCLDTYRSFLHAQEHNWNHAPNLSMTQIFSIAQQGLETLQDFREKGYLHCDLKPENMVYDASNDNLFIFDLETGQMTDKLISALDINNTWFYTAPELCFGYQTYGPSADMWSFGAILFEFYTGKVLIPSHPVDDKSKNEIRADHLRVMAHNLGAFSPQMSQLAHPELQTLLVRTSHTSEVKYPSFDREVMFTMDELTKIHQQYPDMPLWQARIRHAAKLRLADSSEADRMIQLLEPMLCYSPESRINPTDALQLLSILRSRPKSVPQRPAVVNDPSCEFPSSCARVQEDKSDRLRIPPLNNQTTPLVPKSGDVEDACSKGLLDKDTSAQVTMKCAKQRDSKLDRSKNQTPRNRYCCILL